MPKHLTAFTFVAFSLINLTGSMLVNSFLTLLLKTLKKCFSKEHLLSLKNTSDTSSSSDNIYSYPPSRISIALVYTLHSSYKLYLSSVLSYSLIILFKSLILSSLLELNIDKVSFNLMRLMLLNISRHVFLHRLSFGQKLYSFSRIILSIKETLIEALTILICSSLSMLAL